MASPYVTRELEALQRNKELNGKQSLETERKHDIASLARSLRNSETVAEIMGKAFRLFQRMGVSVCPNHFYWPVPDVASLEKRPWAIFPLPSGCDFNLEGQVRFAKDVVLPYSNEQNFTDSEDDSDYHYNNGYFETVDAEIAYGYVRATKPSRIIEIGSGYSTRLLAAALQKNCEEDQPGELTTIDPCPERLPKKSMGADVHVLTESVQQAELELFEELQGGDILFIDSSHVVGVGSDVVREYLEILPKLRPGVTVHLHDIFLPADYPRDSVLKDFWFWSEQYLLQAFLSFNSRFKVLWASSAMQFFLPSALENLFPRWPGSYARMPKEKRRFIPSFDHDRVWPSSFWMQRI
jgi:predicted O-methyltransferase YrrM